MFEAESLLTPPPLILPLPLPLPLSSQVLAAEHDLTARLFEAESLHAQGLLSELEFNEL